MGWRFIKMCAFTLWLPCAANAEDFAFQGRYVLAFSGIPIGKVSVNLAETATNYSAKSDVGLTGLAKLFVQHTSATTSVGTGENYNFTNRVYETRYQTRKKPKYVKMVTKNGVIAEEKVEPPDNRAVRPAVSAADKKGAYDPLALALAIRDNLARCQNEGAKNFTLNYYDGRRLTAVNFAFLGAKTLRISGKKTPTLVLTATRKPLAGYTQNELDDIGPNDPTLNLYFSNDEQMIPLLLQVPLPFGTATATLRM